MYSPQGSYERVHVFTDDAELLARRVTDSRERKAAVGAIKQGLEEDSIQVTIKKPEEAESLDYFDYDFFRFCFGIY